MDGLVLSPVGFALRNSGTKKRAFSSRVPRSFRRRTESASTSPEGDALGLLRPARSGPVDSRCGRAPEACAKPDGTVRGRLLLSLSPDSRRRSGRSGRKAPRRNARDAAESSDARAGRTLLGPHCGARARSDPRSRGIHGPLLLALSRTDAFRGVGSPNYRAAPLDGTVRRRRTSGSVRAEKPRFVRLELRSCFSRSIDPGIFGQDGFPEHCDKNLEGVRNRSR